MRSNGETCKQLDRKIAAQNGICGICKVKFTDYGDSSRSHQPRGMGGAWLDDHPANIQAVHWRAGRRDRAAAEEIMYLENPSAE